MPYKDPNKHREADRNARRRKAATTKPSEVDRWREDPPLFLRENFNIGLWEKQKEIIDSVRDNERTTVRSGNSLGKSFTAAGVALWFLLTHYPSTVITTAPTDRQVRDIIWREMARMCSSSRLPIGGEMLQPSKRLDLEDNWYAVGFSSDESSRFQGYHNKHILVIVDEPSGVEEFIFESIEGILAGGEIRRLLLIGNPMSLSGTYWNSFMDERTAQLYKQIHISAFDCPNVKDNGSKIPGLCTKEWIEERRQEWGEDNPLYQIRVLGEFPQQGIDTLIPLNWITQAIKRECKAEGIKVLGVDIARYGDDETVACLRQGGKLIKIWRWSKQDTMQTTNRLFNIIQTESPNEVRVDVIGIGSGVVDRLKELGVKVKGINVAESAKENNKYTNLRAEIFWQLRERFQKGDIDTPDNSKMVAQLAGLKYEFDSSGKLKLQSKEDMRRKGLKSPDIADALAIAYMEKLKKGLAFVWG